MPNPRRANGSRRDKVRAQVLAEESHCAIPVAEGGCGGLPVDKTLTVQWGKHGPRCKGDGCPGCVPHDWRAEVDEIVPVSAGGDPFDRSNCRLGHRICNRNRNKRHGQQGTSANSATNPFPISDCWGGLFDSLRGGGDPVPPGR